MQTKKLVGFTLKVLVAFLMVSGTNLNAQNFLPYNYWTFDGSNTMADSMNHNPLNPAWYNSPYAITNGSAGNSVGRYLTLNDASKMIVATAPLALDSGMTIEFLFKAGTDINQTVQLFGRRDGAFQIRFTYPTLKFTTAVIPTGGTAAVADNFYIDLRGVGRGSYGYYVDGNWHHFVFRYNAKTGVKEIWVDGQCPVEFQKTVPSGKFAANATNATNNTVDLNTNTDYYKYNGHIDEVAFYKFSLHQNIIYKHYNEFTQNKHYTFNYVATAPPNPASISAGIDPMEYAPGHPTPNVTAVDQLLAFPNPRYKPGNTLFPNIPILNPGRLAGMGQPNVSTSKAVSVSKEIQKQMVTNFNYTLVVSSNTGHGSFTDTTTYDGAWIKMANQNPSWKTSAISYWDQIRPGAQGFSSYDPYINCGCLPNTSYLRNAQGQFLDRNGNVVSYKIISPETILDSIRLDGKTQRKYISSLTTALTRPLDVLFENGEVITHWNETGLMKDPNVLSKKNASGLDWDKYIGNRMAGLAGAYMNEYKTLPSLSNTWIQHYQLTAAPSNWDWSQTRSLMTQKNGMYYSTGDLYVQWPFAWLDGSGMAKGWEDLIDQRYQEISMGDKLFSPVVSPGWSYDEEKTLRPAQWLGFLKAVAVTGAENFQTGYFTELLPPQLPENYIWQVSSPSYVQALTSRYEDILRNGSLLDGDVPARVTGQTGLPGYQFYAGDVRKLVVVRKHNTSSKYVISGTIQNNSNMIGNSELDGVASIKLDGQTLKFNIRKQGSTFIYDKTNSASPVFYQLDGWHESSHPYYWSKTFDLEAELFDNAPSNVAIKTSVPSGTAAGDFTNYTSYVTFSGTSAVEYNVQPRGASAATHYLWVLARSVDGTNTGFNVSLDNGAASSINCITDQNWKWYRFDATTGQAISFNNLSLASHKITISNINNKLQIDRITLTPQSGAYYANGASPCGIIPTATATITTLGSTTICAGNNVTLSANSGTAYLWSTGATTQSINVNAAGSYFVKVFNGTLNATSDPVVITVNALPLNGITATGPTTFCTGGSVELKANSTTGTYLWSPGGATTRSIIVSTSGSYSVVVTNAAGCSVTAQPVVVTSSSSASVPSTAVANGLTTFCEGGSVSLSANAGSAYLWSNGATTQTINASLSGNYSVTVSVNGCNTLPSSPILVKVNPRATFNVTPSGPLTFCSGGSVSLNITNSTGNAYVWYRNNQVISSAGTKSLSHLVTTPGTYKVRVQLGSCGKFSPEYVVTVPCREGETLGDEGFSVNAYPNPFADQTTISVSLIESQKVTIKIYDLEGRLVDVVADGYVAAEGLNEFKYESSHLGKGFYFAVVNAGKETKQIKIASLK